MNGNSEHFEAKIAENSERARKLYRYVNDVARRVSEATTSCNSISSLFSIHLEVQRQKLRDNCEKLIFLDPSNHGKKALDLLWRKVYYDTVSAAKKLREGDVSGNENDNYLFSHIVCGIGHFHHLITRLQSKTKVQIKELDYTATYQDEETEELSEQTSEEEQQFAKSALHSCLIYLGDLSRYQAELYPEYDPSIAARYYLQASHVDMSSGMPFNQLGNLYLDKNYNLDSVCYYIHCLNRGSPFEGAIDNLQKIFEKNSQYCSTLIEPETLTQTEHVQNTIANFLSLIEAWYMNKNDTNIPQRCSEIAQELKIAMDFPLPSLPDMNKNYVEYTQALEEESVNPSYLNSNLIHKMVQICLFTVAKMTETDEDNAFASKAFTLALISQLLQKLLTQLESLGLKHPAFNYKQRVTISESETEKHDDLQTEEVEIKPDIESEMTNGQDDISNGKPTQTIPTENPQEDDIEHTKGEEVDVKRVHNGDVVKKISKKALSKRRRRRREVSSDSSDVSDAESESSEVDTDGTCSDIDESDTTYDSEEEHSEGSICEPSDKEEKVNGTTEEAKEDVVESVKVINGDMNETETPNDKEFTIKESEIEKFLLGNNLLASLKLLLDWLITEKELILSCGDSGESLFQCIVDLLNIFTFYFCSKNDSKDEHFQIFNLAKFLAKKLKLDYKTIPLPEDINLRGTMICKFDKDATEWQILNKYQPTVYEENIIRILNFIEFGNQIGKIVPRIRYNRSMKVFYLKKIPRPKVGAKINHKRSREWHNSKKPHNESSEGGLLRRLGRLWLASRVRELERQPAAPALLALDAAALHSHLRHVKLLVRTRNFVVLVPTVVVQELDDLKREKSSARDAIRWLEMQLKSGSRFLRAQRPGQTKPLPLLKFPRKAPPHVHSFIQILEFCHHFVADEKQSQGGNGDPDNSLHGKSAPLLILLVGNELGNDEYKEFSLTGSAQTAGISVEYIGDFYSKWRQSVHKSGKKR